MILEIKFSKQAEKFLSKQPYPVKIRIVKAIEKIPAGDIKRMSGSRNLYRLRVGDFRVLFEKSKITRTITLIDVAEINNRGQIYK